MRVTLPPRIFSLPQITVSNTLFILLGKFQMKNYEYHVLNNTKFHTKDHGFVFGLIHTANTTLTSSILLDASLANTDLSS